MKNPLLLSQEGFFIMGRSGIERVQFQ